MSAKAKSQEQETSLAVNIGVGVIQTLFFVYDVLTYPLYYAAQQPWKKVTASRKIRSRVIKKSSDELTFEYVFMILSVSKCVIHKIC